ncbi:hypothetical protein RIF29_20612 [Crotalaria pallida]|uniref:Uncharacterized protein n=1 Tax=Crotalaria pallida TaxID=3830 RepID=A0AAN9F4W8_CROPI
MLSTASTSALLHPNPLPYQNPLAFPSHKLTFRPIKPFHLSLSSTTPPPNTFTLSASSAEPAITEEQEQEKEETPLNDTSLDSDSPPLPQEKLGVVVKPTDKPRLVLKFIWMEKNIGIALDQMIPGHGTIPLSPYYFWPRKDAWEELRELLESKPWISQKQMIILLNQATDVINLWQQSGGNLA